MKCNVNRIQAANVKQPQIASRREPRPTLWRRTLELWVFGAMKIPLIFYLRPRVLALTDQTVKLKVRLWRRTKNHYGTMYFGALAIGAELLPGIFSIMFARRLGKSVTFATTHVDASFIKRAMSDVIFSSSDGGVIENQIRSSAASGSRTENFIEVVATSLAEDSEQVVAKFRFKISIKAK